MSGSELTRVAVRTVSASKASGPEREYPRYAAEVSITFYVGTQTIVGRTRNMSRGGLCADLDTALPIGQDVEIDVVLRFEDNTKSEPLRLPVRIVWCTALEGGHQIGVSFRPLDKRRADFLTLFLKYLAEDKPEKTPKAKDIDDRFG